MALGALIGAYQEDDSGGLRALLPLAGRTLIEYQARCLAATGAAPLVVLVERVPVALNEAFERLRGEGIGVVPVSDGLEAASRFEAGTQILLLADGIAPDMSDLALLVEEPGAAILTFRFTSHPNQSSMRYLSSSSLALCAESCNTYPAIFELSTPVEGL